MLSIRDVRNDFTKALLRAMLLVCLIAVGAASAQTGPRWWKGNLHTHTFWSDGDDFPEMVVQWYQTHGYHFLALSDHNVLSQGQRWMAVTDGRRGYDSASHPVKDAEGKEIRTTRRYSQDIGRVLAQEEGTTARYTLKGDEIYVRAKVISSRKNAKSHVPGECESA
jgi:predicted metal-dependent phosphoesterase TrpH